MNQLDLCGASGLAPFYLSMSRALDVLLALPNADPERVAVSGLSGGGWQTIFISSLSTPASSSATRSPATRAFARGLRYPDDTGDSEQTPSDLATVADYTHLTAMMAAAPTLLTYNAKDSAASRPATRCRRCWRPPGRSSSCYGSDQRLQSHVNHDPGTHNYEIDNRQAFYRLLGDLFFPGDRPGTQGNSLRGGG